MVLFSWLTSSRAADYFLSSLLAVAVAALVGIYSIQKKLIYVPHFPPDSRKTVWRPDKFGLSHYKEITIRASDGVGLHCYWIPSRDGGSLAKVPTILFLHANAGNMGHRLPIARQLAMHRACNIFMLSYRGYGESEGTPDEEGIRRDAQAALDYLLDELKGDIDVNSIVVYGQSIGGAVAIDLVARNQSKIAGLIVENSFLSLPKLIPSILPILGPISGLCNQKWDSESKIHLMIEGCREDKSLGFPKTLLLVGEQDELIPPAHLKAIHRAIHSVFPDRVAMSSFPDGSHNDTWIQPGYFPSIGHFLEALSDQ